MTHELTWLLFTALFTGSLWVPYVIGANVTDFPGKAEQFVRPPNPSAMAPWVHRSWRAHQNALEQLVPFAVVVSVGTFAEVSTPITRWSVVIYFALRVVHAVGMITGVARLPLRPLLYFSGWVAMLAYASQVLLYG